MRRLSPRTDARIVARRSGCAVGLPRTRGSRAIRLQSVPAPAMSPRSHRRLRQRRSGRHRLSPSTRRWTSRHAPRRRLGRPARLARARGRRVAPSAVRDLADRSCAWCRTSRASSAPWSPRQTRPRRELVLGCLLVYLLSPIDLVPGSPGDGLAGRRDVAASSCAGRAGGCGADTLRATGRAAPTASPSRR